MDEIDDETNEFLHQLENKLADLVNKNTGSYLKKFGKKLEVEHLVLCLGTFYARFCYSVDMDEEETCDTVANIWETFEEIGVFQAMEEESEPKDKKILN